MDWNALLNKKPCDADNVFSSFYNKFNKLINKHAPMKTISNRKAKQLSKPWITKGIRISIKVKNKLYASGDTANYKIYRNKICTLTRLSKQQYYSKFFNDNLTNMKKTWEGINNVLARKLKNTKPITLKILLIRWMIRANERENSFPLFQRWRMCFQDCK